MSFSKKVKDELFDRYPAARHCMLAELAAMTLGCGTVVFEGDRVQELEICTENEALARKYFTLLQKIFNIVDVEIRERKPNAQAKGNAYSIILRKEDGVERIGRALKLEHAASGGDGFCVNPLIAQNTCCKRAYIRGGFLAGGSLSDPKKAYHFEVVFSALEKAEQMKQIFQSFLIEAKVIRRKKYFVLYVKEGAQIVDLLNIMEAHLALMELENVRILKEVRNANITKTVKAAAKQLEDIRYIRDSIGFEKLPEGLREIAKLRMEYPEASLKELGEMLSVPLGKSGVNHRLKRLGEIAESGKAM